MNTKTFSTNSTKNHMVETRAVKNGRVILSHLKLALVYSFSFFVLSCSSGQEELSHRKNTHVEQPEQGYPVESLSTSKASTKRKTDKNDRAYVKPGAAVVLADPSARTVDDLGVYTFNFGFIASPTQGTLRVSLGSSDSLAIVSPQKEQSFDLATDELRLDVTVQAKDYGRHVLTFFTELDGLRRVVSVTVQAGPVAVQDSQKIGNGLNAPKVIPMKAEETISNGD